MGTNNWASLLIFVIQQSNSPEHSTSASGGESRTSTSSRTVGLRGWVATEMPAPGTKRTNSRLARLKFDLPLTRRLRGGVQLIQKLSEKHIIEPMAFRLGMSHSCA